tara:strand:+ start:65141 stop:65323 length:183 start_codon:yes stop_codon:yes gene_type:complete
MDIYWPVGPSTLSSPRARVKRPPHPSLRADLSPKGEVKKVTNAADHLSLRGRGRMAWPDG